MDRELNNITIGYIVYTDESLSVTDLINRIVQVLRGDLYWFRISAQDAELMEPVEP